MKSRQSNFELLRLLAIFFIVVSHFSFHGYYLDPNRYEWINNPINRIILKSLNLGNLGVDLFVLLCGYFSVSNESVNYHRLVKLELSVLFYTIGIYSIHILSGGKFVLKEMITTIFPTCFGAYWFFTVYLILVFFSPFINRGLSFCIGNKAKEQNLQLLLGMLFAWSFVPTFMGTSFYGDEVPTFIMLYILGACIRYYGFKLLQKHKKLYLETVLN